MEIVKYGDDRYQVFVDAYRLASTISLRSACLKNHSGAIVFEMRDGRPHTLGTGYNAPTARAKCCMRADIHGGRNVELCTAVHAEQMAVLNAARTLEAIGPPVAPTYLVYAKFKPQGAGYRPARLDPENVSCTICSRLLSWYGISFVCPVEAGFAIMDAQEYNLKSLQNCAFLQGRGHRE